MSQPLPLPDEPQPPSLPPWRRRLWLRVKRLFVRRLRVLPLADAALLGENEALRDEVYRLRQKVFGLEHQLALEDSQKKILQEELALLAAVHARDRARVEADAAMYDPFLLPRRESQGRDDAG